MKEIISSYYVYAIQSMKDSRVYIGMSYDVNKRLIEHNSGTTKSKKRYMPWKLVYSEFVGMRIDARKREKYLKSGYGREQLKFLIKNNPTDSLNYSKTFTSINHFPINKNTVIIT